jgi:hypothetical protein
VKRGTKAERDKGEYLDAGLRDHKLKTSDDTRALIARLIAFKENAIGVGEKLLAAFHQGLPVTELEPLLRHENSAVSTTAGWILSELGRRGAPLLKVSADLLVHPEEEIRADAITSILANSESCSPNASFAVLSRYDVENLRIRKEIINYISRAPLTLLQAAVSESTDPAKTRHANGVALLTGCLADSENILNELNSADELLRGYALAALRRYDLVLRKGLRIASRSTDVVLSDCATRWMKDPTNSSD